MDRPDRHVIHTRADGLLGSRTTPADVVAIARAAAAADRVVIHFHGGLVSATRGLETAQRLTGEYEAAGAYPVFFVWSSGLVETVTGNLREILVEDLCRQLLRWLLRYTVGKLTQAPGQRGTVLTLPGPMEVRRELDRTRSGAEPYAGLRPRAVVPAVDRYEREQLQDDVGQDERLADELAAILATRRPTTPARRGSRGTRRRRASARTLMSPEVLDEIDPGSGAGQRGIVSTALLAKKLGAVFTRVVARFRAGTDHGVYPTVLEELLRELYLANVGAAVWAAMKKDTADTFAADGRPRGGALFLRELGAALGASARVPAVTVVGHSTGAVFIDNLLDALARAAGDTDDPTPRDLRLRNVVMLAPACTFTHLAGALQHRDLVERFRIFTMTDDAERADHLVPGLYPRSLLYLVSGLLERDPSGASAHMPVAGLQRYYVDERYAALDGIGGVRDYTVATPDRLVWSPSPPDAPAGLRSAARSHGGFDEDPEVLGSIRNLVAGGNG